MAKLEQQSIMKWDKKTQQKPHDPNSTNAMNNQSEYSNTFYVLFSLHKNLIDHVRKSKFARTVQHFSIKWCLQFNFN